MMESIKISSVSVYKFLTTNNNCDNFKLILPVVYRKLIKPNPNTVDTNKTLSVLQRSYV